MRTTANEIRARKNGEKITVISAYDYPAAKLLDGKVDIILVGDSLGMVIYGMNSTHAVTLPMMAAHAKAVVNASNKSLVVIDMPFGSYQESPAQAFASAAYLIAETGVQAVKIEGGSEMAETAKFLIERGIPVMGHLGMQPQSFNVYGGFKVQGKDEKNAKKIIAAAKDLEAAGCFALVLESVPRKLADKITKDVNIPTIGIGASPDCDGQVLVLHDILGFGENKPKFTKNYAGLNKIIAQAISEYVRDVKAKKFPEDKNCY